MTAKKLDLERLKALCEKTGLTIGEQAVFIAAAREALPLLVAEVERLQRETMCGVCGGTPPVSGLPCICGGTGKAADEALHARRYVVDIEALLAKACARIEELQDGVNNIPNLIQDVMKERDAARALAERRKKALEPFVAFMARWVLPTGPMDRALSSTAWDEAKAAHDAGEEKK